MKIGNPFNAQHVRVTCRTPKNETIGVQSDRVEINIPDDTSEAFLEAVMYGRSDSPAWANRMWVRDRGFMDLSDYKALLKVEEERKQLEAEREKERQRKAKEARERTESKAKRSFVDQKSNKTEQGNK